MTCIIWMTLFCMICLVHSDFEVTRLPSNPIIHALLPGLKELGEEGKNINGPSVIHVPAWVPGRKGNYYLYFASHVGNFIRMAYADAIGGPWTVLTGGVLQLTQVPSCHGHIASPEVLIEDHTIWLFFHCVVRSRAAIPMDWDSRSQCTAAVSSADGIHFQVPDKQQFIGPFYFRLFKHNDTVYALAKRRGPGGGVIYKCPHPTIRQCANVPFVRGPQVIDHMRHAAVVHEGSILRVFFSRVGDAPESIYFRRISLGGDWSQWASQAEDDILVLAPKEKYEGAHLPITSSPSGPSKGMVRQLRDPAVLIDDDGMYLFYSVGGEHGIAVARLTNKMEKQGNETNIHTRSSTPEVKQHHPLLRTTDRDADDMAGSPRVQVAASDRTDVNGRTPTKLEVTHEIGTSWSLYLMSPGGMTVALIAGTGAFIFFLRRRQVIALENGECRTTAG